MITRDFVTAGKAIFTVSNNKGDHYTFKVVHKEADGGYKECWFVNLLTGPENTSDYTYLGMLNVESGEVRLTKASKYGDSTMPVKVVRWALGLIWKDGKLPEGYAIQHAGYCCRCGRLLTTPDSIENGIGPECAKIVGGDRMFVRSEPLNLQLVG